MQVLAEKNVFRNFRRRFDALRIPDSLEASCFKYLRDYCEDNKDRGIRRGIPQRSGYPM